MCHLTNSYVGQFCVQYETILCNIGYELVFFYMGIKCDVKNTFVKTT